MKHDQKPETVDEIPEDLRKRVDELTSSDYYRYVEGLVRLVQGRVVEASSSGKSGFLLRFSDGDWVAAYLRAGCLAWDIGAGAIPERIPKQLDQVHSVNALGPLGIDRSYADEVCDISSEVANCHGLEITGIAVGEDTFNFCFPDGMELDTMIVFDGRGRPGLRVFWEQW